MIENRLRTFEFANRFHNGFDEMNLLVMREQVVARKPIDDPKQHVWWQFERCQCETDANNVRLSKLHQANTEFGSNSSERFQARLFTFQCLKRIKQSHRQVAAIEVTVFFECSDKSCRISALSDSETFQFVFVVSAFNASNKRTISGLLSKTAHINGVRQAASVTSISLPQATNVSQTTAASTVRDTAWCNINILRTVSGIPRQFGHSPLSVGVVYVCGSPNKKIDILQRCTIHGVQQR